MTPEHLDDPELRAHTGWLLRGGSAAAGTLLAGGLLQAALGRPDSAAAWILPGIVIMITTPVARVALIAAGFGRQGRWRFCAVSAAVLFLLIGGIFLGRHH